MGFSSRESPTAQWVNRLLQSGAVAVAPASAPAAVAFAPPAPAWKLSSLLPAWLSPPGDAFAGTQARYAQSARPWTSGDGNGQVTLALLPGSPRASRLLRTLLPRVP